MCAFRKPRPRDHSFEVRLYVKPVFTICSMKHMHSRHRAGRHGKCTARRYVICGFSVKNIQRFGSPQAAREYSTGAFQYSHDAEAKGWYLLLFRSILELTSYRARSAIYSKIPVDTEILLTHTPPLGILDTTQGGNQVGCQVLAQAVGGLQSCRLHLFGHIHESHGVLLACEPNTDGRRRISVNGAMYRLGQPIVVDLKD